MAWDIDKDFAWERLNTYDLITEDWEAYSYDTDECLHARSALEFLREDERLTEGEAARLERIDAFWREHAQAFNHHFRFEHVRKDMDNELDGWVADDDSNHPRIPMRHWWWRPVEVE